MIEKRKRVTLEVELEAIAGGFDATERLKLARTLRRWAHQLTISARLLARPPTPPRRYRRLSPRQQALN